MEEATTMFTVSVDNKAMLTRVGKKIIECQKRDHPEAKGEDVDALYSLVKKLEDTAGEEGLELTFEEHTAALAIIQVAVRHCL